MASDKSVEVVYIDEPHDLMTIPTNAGSVERIFQHDIGGFTFRSMWKTAGLAVITDVRNPGTILRVQHVWERQHRDYAEYIVGSERFMFSSWPMNHTRRISMYRDAMRLNYGALHLRDTESSWLKLADF